MPPVSTIGVTGCPFVRTYQSGVVNILRGQALVQGASDAQLVPATVANSQVIAIAQESTINVGDPLSAVVEGEAVGIAGAPVVAGQYVVTNAASQLVPSAAVGDNVIGRAVNSQATVGGEFVVFVNPFIR